MACTTLPPTATGMSSHTQLASSSMMRCFSDSVIVVTDGEDERNNEEKEECYSDADGEDEWVDHDLVS